MPWPHWPPPSPYVCPDVGKSGGAPPLLNEPATLPCEEAVTQLRQRTNLFLAFFFFLNQDCGKNRHVRIQIANR